MKPENLSKEINQQLENILAENQLNQDKIVQCLTLMNRFGNYIEQHANGYPHNPMTADIWLYGRALMDYSKTFFNYLWQNHDWQNAKYALDFWHTGLFSVASHYRHLVGDFMTHAIMYYEKMGDFDKVLELHESVMLDFEYSLEFAEDGLEEKFTQEDWESFAEDVENCAVSYLETSANYLSQFGSVEQKQQAREMLARLKKLPRFWDKN